jgi:transposase
LPDRNRIGNFISLKEKMKTYSLDLRQKIVEVYDRGEISQRDLAERFCVSVFFVKKLFRQRRLRGTIAPLAKSGWQKGVMTLEVQDYLVKLCRENNKMKQAEMIDRIEAEFNIRPSKSTVCRALKSLKLRKK